MPLSTLADQTWIVKDPLSERVLRMYVPRVFFAERLEEFKNLFFVVFSFFLFLFFFLFFSSFFFFFFFFFLFVCFCFFFFFFFLFFFFFFFLR